jgi:probable rRNA maturation factor
MIEVEVFGASLAPEAPRTQEIRRLCTRAAASRGVSAGHVAIEFVEVARIARLNAEYRGKAGPTDVLSFPIDGIEPISAAPAGVTGDVAAEAERDPGAQPRPAPAGRELLRELGDVVICPEHTVDVREAIVHGMLHLLGMDHERDHGEMLALQRELLAGAHP